MKNKQFLILLVVSILALAAAQCQPAPGERPLAEEKGGTARADIRIVVVTHGQASDPFWAVVRKGAEQAAQDMGVRWQYQAPDTDTLDVLAMADLIDAAVASQPDGLVVSIPDAETLSPSIRSAVDAGIPVISINSGSQVAQELGILTHVGQTEYEAGFGAGAALAAAGVKNALCVNHEVGNHALELRCEGFADALAEVDGTSYTLAVILDDPKGTQQRVQMALDANPDVDGIMTLGAAAAAPILKALKQEGLVAETQSRNHHPSRDRREIKLATFDLSPAVLKAIDAGEILFAIDQQPYLQGYLPIVMLTLYNTNANALAEDVILTGPGFVTQDNVARVIELSEAGTR